MSKHFAWWRRLGATAVVVGGLMAGQVLMAEIPPPPPPPDDPIVDEDSPEPEAPPTIDEILTLDGDASQVISQLTSNAPIVVIQRLPGLNPLSGMVQRRDRLHPIPEAGELRDLRLDVDYSTAGFDDDLLDGNGLQRAIGATLTGMYAERYLLGLGIANNYYRIYGPLDLLINTQSVNFFTLYQVTQNFSFGGFVDFSQTDIEDSLVSDSDGNVYNLGDQYDRWGAGLMGSATAEWAKWNWGMTSTLASMNKSSLARVFDDEDTAWATLLETSRSVTDRLLLSVHGTFVHLLDNETAMDGTFWYLGADGYYKLSEQVTFGLGLEKTAGYNNYEEDYRLNMSLTFLF